MGYFLGIDTSNYTTSVALYNSDDDSVISFGKLLSVKSGELGLRQSDAVFEHIKQFSDVICQIPSDLLQKISAVGVSVKPSEAENSYMPCFLTGKTIAQSIAHSFGIPCYCFSHQAGHLISALHSADKMCLIKDKFIAFHISGGTTDMLLVEQSNASTFKITLIGKSLDLKFGQAVDRLGKLLGMPFPSGKYLDELSLNGENKLPFPKKLIGSDCTISGFENKFNEYHRLGNKPEDIAASFFNSVADVLIKMSNKAREEYGNLSVIFSGGVMSNTIIRNKIINELSNSYFAEPEFSRDNASGPAILGYLKSVGEI